MSTEKFTFGMLNLIAAFVLAANLLFLKTQGIGLASVTLPIKDSAKKAIAPAMHMDKFTLIFPKQEKPAPDLFKKRKNIITFNTNPTAGIVFRIQVLASKDQIPLFSQGFNGLNNMKEEYENGLYKYTVGEFRQPVESESTFYMLENKGYNDCYLVAYKDEKRIKIRDALETIRNRHNY